MGAIQTAGNAAFRDYLVDGISASGANQVDKAAVRSLFATVDGAVNAASLTLPALNLLTSGADPTYTDDCTGVLLSCIDKIMTTGQPLYIPDGRYKCSQQAIINLAKAATTGLMIYGDGRARSILDFRTCTISPNILISNSIASQSYIGDGSNSTFAIPASWTLGVRAQDAVIVNGTPVSYSVAGSNVVTASPPALNATVVVYPALDNTYIVLRDLGVIGSVNGVLMQLGRSDFGDPINVPHFDRVNIQNFNTGGFATGLQLNSVLGGRFSVCVNGGGIGAGFAALDMRQCAFNAFDGCSVGTSQISVYMRDGYNFGNVFTAPDFENSAICVQTTSPHNSDNTFLGGRWSYSNVGIYDGDGANLRIVAPNMGPIAPASAQGFVGGRGTGVIVDSAPPGVTPPSVVFSTTPGTAWTNVSGYRLAINVWGGANVSSIGVDGFNVPLTSGTFIVAPGHTLTPNYTGSGGYTKPSAIASFV